MCSSICHQWNSVNVECKEPNNSSQCPQIATTNPESVDTISWSCLRTPQFPSVASSRRSWCSVTMFVSFRVFHNKPVLDIQIKSFDCYLSGPCLDEIDSRSLHSQVLVSPRSSCEFGFAWQHGVDNPSETALSINPRQTARTVMTGASYHQSHSSRSNT